MLDILFAFFASVLLYIPQLSFHFSVFGLPLEIGFTTLLIIYIGFTFSFWRGLLSVILVSFIAETFSLVPHGYLVTAYVILFISIQIILDEVLAESYLTKSMWVLGYSFLSQIITGFVFEAGTSFLSSGPFWIGAVLQATFNGILSFPLFIFLDFLYDRWNSLFSRRKGQLTGADFFQLKSKQRKYF